MHPNYTDLYRELGLAETKVNSIRKAISLCRKSAPRFIIAEFFYAYSTNYSGVHKSNLDVLLISLNKYAPTTRMIVLADKEDARHWDVLNDWDERIRGRLVHPTSRDEMRDLLT
jgi:hypothetical protein